MNIALVDDDPAARQALLAVLKEYAAANRLELRCDAFPNAEALLAEYRPLQYTVIFLDIYMDGMSGVEAAERIRVSDRDTLLVFLTTSADHMPDAFRHHAYDYIRKPVDARRVFRLLDDILRRCTEADAARLTFSSDRQDVSLPYGDIKLVRTGSNNYLEIVDCRARVWKTRMTFSAVSGQLSADSRFLPVLRGVLVNMDYILDCSGGICRLAGDIQLPVNVKNSRRIEQIWRNYTFARIRRESLERGERK